LSVDEACQSQPSSAQLFVTALFDGWDDDARWIWPSNASAARFGFLRREVDINSGLKCTKADHSNSNASPTTVVRALLFASASVDPTILSAFKIYFGSSLVAIGPGRGEAPIKAGNGTFSGNPYVTLDVTEIMKEALTKTGGSSFVVAVEGQSPMGDTAWDPWDPNGRHVQSLPPAVLVQLEITRSDGTSCTVVTDTSHWLGLPADDYYSPIRNTHVWYNQVVENIDARAEPVGWRSVVYNRTATNWAPAVDVKLSFAALQPKMARPVQIFKLAARPMRPPPPVPPSPTPAANSTSCGIMNAVHGNPRLRLDLTCPSADEIVTSVFATFGSPQGSCATRFKPNRTCQTSTTAQKLVEGLCLGKSKCSIPVSADEFGDPPCPEPHKLAAFVNCSKAFGRYIVDFEQEFQGGLVISLPQGTKGIAGQRIKIVAGEVLKMVPGSDAGDPVFENW
jgi:hypothetical protein